MKIVTLKENFLEGLAALERAVGVATNLPILKSVLFRAEKNAIRISATNLEFAIQCVIPGKIVEEGECAIPFSILNAITKNVASERVTIEETDRKINLSTDNYEAAIQGQNAKDFPIIPPIHSTDRSIKISQETFRDALSQVIVAVQFSEIRPEISGVLFRYEKGELALVGTDSFRLVEKILRSGQVTSTIESVSMIVPLKTAEELLKLLGGKGDVEIFIDPTQVLFRTETKELTSRLIDGNFPEYHGVIPKETKTEAIVERQEFLSAVKLTAAFSGKTQGISLTIGEGKKFMELHSADSALGENRYRVATKLKGDKFTITFNWRYLLDGLRIYKGEEVMLGIVSSDRAAVIRSHNDPSLLYLLMPLKV